MARKDIMKTIAAAASHGFNPLDIAVSVDLFAKAVAHGAELRAAFKKAFNMKETGPSELGWAAVELSEKPQVADLIEKYKAEIVTEKKRKEDEASATFYDINRAMTDARLAYEAARDRGNASAMVAASTLMAKLHGLLVDKQEVRQGPLKGLSDSELDAEIAKYASIAVIEKAKETT